MRDLRVRDESITADAYVRAGKNTVGDLDT